MDNYYTKYLKYKNKYLELKRANGGIIGGGVIGGGGIIGGGVIGENITEKGLVGGELKPCNEVKNPEIFSNPSVW